MGLNSVAFRYGAGTGFSGAMKFFTPDRPVGVARARICSITCVVGRRGVGPLARRGGCRGSTLGAAGCAGIGARSTQSAWETVSVGWVAGDGDPGDRGGDARLRRVRHVGGHRPGRSAGPTGYSVATAP